MSCRDPQQPTQLQMNEIIDLRGAIPTTGNGGDQQCIDQVIIDLNAITQHQIMNRRQFIRSTTPLRQERSFQPIRCCPPHYRHVSILIHVFDTGNPFCRRVSGRPGGPTRGGLVVAMSAMEEMVVVRTVAVAVCVGEFIEQA